MSESTYENALSRRRLLQGAGAVVATVGASPWLIETASAAPAAASAVGGKLDYMSWQGYDSPKSLTPWVKKNGVTFKPTYIASHDDIQAKILALHGGKGYDLITYYQGYKELYDQLKILSPIDESKIPNLKGLLPFFKSNYRGFWVKNGVRTAVPMYWGALGLVYDSKAMKAPTSYDVLFSSAMKGKVTVDDDPVGVYTLAGHILGINVAKMTPAQFDKITVWLQKLVKQSKGVAPSYGDCAKRIADGDAAIGFPGWAAQVGFAAGSGNKNVRFVLPKEGGYAFCDSWAIPVSCDNPDTAYAYINNAISPQVHAKTAIEQILGGVTVAGAVKYLDKQTRSLYDYKDLNKFFAKAPLYSNPPLKSSSFVTIDKVIAKWQEIKASA